MANLARTLATRIERRKPTAFNVAVACCGLGPALALIWVGMIDDVNWNHFVADSANGCQLISLDAKPAEPTLSVETWYCNGVRYSR